MSQEYDPMKVKKLTGRVTSVESCTQLPIDLVGGMSYEVRRDGNLGKEIIYTALRLVGFGKTTESVRFDFPASWQEMLRQRLRDRYPWMKRVIREPRMSPHWKDVEKFEKVCPHVGQGMMPTRDDCLEWVMMDEIPAFREVRDQRSSPTPPYPPRSDS